MLPQYCDPMRSWYATLCGRGVRPYAVVFLQSMGCFYRIFWSFSGILSNMADNGDEFERLKRIEEAAGAGDKEWQMELVHFYDEEASDCAEDLKQHTVGDWWKYSEEEIAQAKKKIEMLNALSLFWCRKASENGVGEAQYALWLSGGKMDSLLLEKAINSGCYRALFEIGAFEDSYRLAIDTSAKGRVLYGWGKRLFEKGESKAEREKGLLLIKKSASIGFERAERFLKQALTNGTLEFSYWYFSLSGHFSSWNDEITEVSKEVFDKEKGRYKKLCDMTAAILSGFFLIFQERYGEEFFADVLHAGLISSRVFFRYGHNAAIIWVFTDTDEWRETLVRFLDVFVDQSKSADEIIACAKENNIIFAEQDYSNVMLNDIGNAVLFFDGEVNFCKIGNIEKIKHLELSNVCKGIRKFFYNEIYLSSLEDICLPKRVFGKTSYKYFKNSHLKSLNHPCFNIHDGFVFSIDGKKVLGCTNSDAADIRIDMQGVEEIEEGAFAKSAIKSVFIADSVKKIGEGAFNNCSSLESVRLPDALEEIESNCFEGCSSLVLLDIPESVKKIGSSAFSYSALETLEIPNSVELIEYSAFSHSNLKSLSIGDSVKVVGSNLFESCSCLESVFVGKGVKTIKKSMFLDCEKLKSVEGMESVETIESEAFRNCSSLKAIKFLPHLKNIMQNAFATCNEIKEMTLPKSVKRIFFESLPPYLLHLHYCGTDNEWSYISINNAYNRELIKILSTDETGVLKTERDS